jgi:1A family penicillin-binding protein
MQILFGFLFYSLVILVQIANSIYQLVLYISSLFGKAKKALAFHKPRTRKQAKVSLFFFTKFRTKKPSRKKSSHQNSSRKEPVFPLPFTAKLRYFFVGVVFSFLFLFFPLVTLTFLQELPNPNELTTRSIPQTTKIYDRNNTLLYEIYSSQNRTLVSLSDIPKNLQLATLAIEDKNFYKHPGFDIPSIIRAAKENVEEGGKVQGASTITQQLIKSSMLSTEKRFTRKIKEVILAFWAERIYTKNQILEMYFNQVPYGGTAWGAEAAAEVYFNKNVKDLSLAESAFLAGITAAPTTYSPFGDNPKLWKERQREVLSRMVELGYIAKNEADEASDEELIFHQRDDSIKAPHFVNYVRDFLIEKYGIAAVERGGLRVVTSLDLKTQEMAQQAVREVVDASTYLNLTNGAALITNPITGDILAMVGSRDYSDPNGGNVNVTNSLRQPGSSIKVVTYSAALSRGMTAASTIQDAPITYQIPGSQSYSPVNYDGRYYGNVPIRFALANSLNIPAVKVLNQIGVDTMVNFGRDMGITHWGNNRPYGLSTTLGGAEVTMLDMATVFGTLANGGVRHDLNPILRITDYKGAIIEEKTKDLEGRRVLSEGVAFIISDILRDNLARSVAFGMNTPLIIPGHLVSVKTGTTDNKRDNWTIGYTKDFVVAVWVGNNDNTPMSQTLASGVTGAAPIWHRIMVELLKDKIDSPVSAPSDVVQKECYGRYEYFIRGTERQATCQRTRFPQQLPTPLTR